LAFYVLNILAVPANSPGNHTKLNMNEGRLWAVNREVKGRNILVHMNKVKSKERMKVKIKKWNKEMKNFEYNADRATVPVCRNLNELNAYSFALKARRRKFKPTQFGIYDGITYRELKPDIKKVLDENQPTVKRLKETEKLLTDGVKRGEIIPLEKSQTKFDDLMEKPFEEYKQYLNNREKTASTISEMPRYYDFATGIFGGSKSKEKEKKKTPEPEQHQHRRKLVLPPLHVKKEMTEVLERFKRLGTNININVASKRDKKLTNNMLPTTNINPVSLPKIKLSKQKTVF